MPVRADAIEVARLIARPSARRSLPFARNTDGAQQSGNSATLVMMAPSTNAALPAGAAQPTRGFTRVRLCAPIIRLTTSQPTNQPLPLPLPLALPLLHSPLGSIFDRPRPVRTRANTHACTNLFYTRAVRYVTMPIVFIASYEHESFSVCSSLNLMTLHHFHLFLPALIKI